MPVITDIKRQKRTQSRYSVYVDGAYSFALSDLEFSGSGLRVGQSLTEEQIVRYQTDAGHSKFYAMAVRFVAVRPRSSREVENYLGRKDCPAEEVPGVLERLRQAGLLDDGAFAAAWVADRQALRPRSRRMLEQELQAKGVDRTSIEIALAQLEPDDLLGSLMQLMRKKQRLPQYRDEQKLVQYLARQGYEYELIKKALARLSDE